MEKIFLSFPLMTNSFHHRPTPSLEGRSFRVVPQHQATIGPLPHFPRAAQTMTHPYPQQILKKPCPQRQCYPSSGPIPQPKSAVIRVTAPLRPMSDPVPSLPLAVSYHMALIYVIVPLHLYWSAPTWPPKKYRQRYSYQCTIFPRITSP